MTDAEKAKKAQEEYNLDLNLVKDNEELTRFVQVLNESRAIGQSISWYWSETAQRFSAHDAKNRYSKEGDAAAGVAEEGDCFVKYSSIIAAQLEFFWRRMNTGTAADAADAGAAKGGRKSLTAAAPSSKHLIDIDISGRCNDGGGEKGNFDHLGSGSKYQVNLVKMTQMNKTTGFERPILRVVDHQQAAQQEKKRTWEQLSAAGVSLEQLKKSCLDDTTFLLGTPLKILLLSAETVEEREAWEGAFRGTFQTLASAGIGGGDDASGGGLSSVAGAAAAAASPDDKQQAASSTRKSILSRLHF